jgi:hypothetical protein
MVPHELQVQLWIFAFIVDARASDDLQVTAMSPLQRLLSKSGDAEYSGVHFLVG